MQSHKYYCIYMYNYAIIVIYSIYSEEFPMKESTVYDNVATSATTDTGEQERDAHFYEPVG